ncbi:MAG: hypothetical protein ACYDBN_03665 [Acidimicrobiales bacterium]
MSKVDHSFGGGRRESQTWSYVSLPFAPPARHTQVLRHQLHCHREFYSAALEERLGAWT